MDFKSRYNIDPLTKKPASSRERGHKLMYEKFN